MTVATFVQPNYNTQSGTAYPLGIDAAFAAFLRLAASFAPHEQATPNMSVRIAAGPIFTSGGALQDFAAQATGTITAPAGNPRRDIVYLDVTSGVAGVATGAEAASPVDPAIPAGKVPLARINLATSTTAITNAILDDLRVLNSLGLVATQAEADARILSGKFVSPALIAEGVGLGGTNLTAASTTTLPTVGDYFLVDSQSPVSINAISARARGRTITLVFASSNITLVHSANIILAASGSPQNIAPANGDAARFVSDGGGVWRLTDYWRTDGRSINIFTSGLHGLVPASGGGTANFLRADATFAAPSPIAKSYTSAGQTITSAGALTLAHSMGVFPAFVTADLECQTGEHGYSAGDRITISPTDDNGNNVQGMAITKDSTNLYVRFSSAANVFLVPHKTTGARSALTNGNWKVILRAYA